MAKRIRGAKFHSLNESPEEKAQRDLQQEAARTQAIQRETAELERQAVLRAEFHATPEDFQILNQLVDAGGRIPAEQILISDAARTQIDELRYVGLVDRYGDGAGLLVGFSITRHGLAMIRANNENSSQVRILPAVKRDAASNVSRELKNLLFWAERPDPIALTFDWADACRRNLNDVVDSAVSAFAGDKQAIRQLKSVRTLAMDFIGLMVDRPKLSTVPPERWTVQAYRQLFEDLSELQRAFRIMGDAVEIPVDAKQLPNHSGVTLNPANTRYRDTT